jgi:hypothetical protein
MLELAIVGNLSRDFAVTHISASSAPSCMIDIVDTVGFVYVMILLTSMSGLYLYPQTYDVILSFTILRLSPHVDKIGPRTPRAGFLLSHRQAQGRRFAFSFDPASSLCLRFESLGRCTVLGRCPIRVEARDLGEFSLAPMTAHTRVESTHPVHPHMSLVEGRFVVSIQAHSFLYKGSCVSMVELASTRHRSAILTICVNVSP